MTPWDNEAMAASWSLRFIVALMVVFGLPTSARSGAREPIKFADTQYEPLDWSALDGWAADDHAAAFATFLASCRALNGTRQPGREATAINEALKPICERAVAAIPLEEEGARKFFEDNFRPLRISKLGDAEGFLTGYYEPIIDGSRVPTGEFTAPLYRRPPNLVVAGRRKLGDSFPARESKSAAASAAARSCRITTAARSRTARSTAGIWKSVGCAARSTCCSRRSRARRGSGWKTAPSCASTTTRTTAGPILRSAAC